MQLAFNMQSMLGKDSAPLLQLGKILGSYYSQSSLYGLLQSCDCITAQLSPYSTLVSFPSSHSCWSQGHSPVHFFLTWNMISMKLNLQQLCWIVKILKIFFVKWRKQSCYQFLVICPTKLTKNPFDANFYDWKRKYTNILSMHNWTHKKINFPDARNKKETESQSFLN